VIASIAVGLFAGTTLVALILGLDVGGARDWLRRFGVALAFGLRADPRRLALLFVSETVAGIAHLVALFGLKLLTDAAVARSGSGVLVAAGVIALAGTAHYLGRHGYLTSTMEVGERAGLLLDARLMALMGGAAALEHHERPEYAD
jgi:ATP-binding cassette subfamily B protein